MIKYKSLLLLAAVILLAIPLYAQSGQTYYRLSVQVLDSSSRVPLQAASIVLEGVSKAEISDARGRVVFHFLAAGTYVIKVSYLGYHPYERKINLTADTEILAELCTGQFHLHDVEVYERQMKMKENVIGQSIQTLHKAELDALKGQTVAEMMKQMQGVNLLSTGPSIAKPVIRGLHSQRLLLMNGGVRQEGQQWGAEHGPEIDPFMPEELQVVKGPASVEYGPEAIGGVVKLEPRPFKTEDGVSAEAGLNFFSNNRQAAASLLSEGHHHYKVQHFSWWVRGSYRKAGDSRAPDYVMSNTGFREEDYAAGLEWKRKKMILQSYYSHFGTELGILRGAHIDNRNDLLRAIQSPQPFYTKAFTYSIGNPRQEISHDLFSLRWVYDSEKLGRFLVQYATQLNERKEYDAHYIYNDSIRALRLPGYELSLNTYTTDVKLEHKPIGRISGRLGFSYMYQGNYAAGQRFLIPNFIARTTGLYWIEKWQKNRWTLECGSRYDWRSMDIYQNISGKVQEERKAFGRLTFIAGSSWMLNEYMLLKANLASAWRPPAVNELYSNGLHGGTATYETGDKNLQPEQALNADLGMKYNRGRWLLDLSVYSNHIQHFIYQRPDTGVTVTIRGSFPTWRYVQHDVRLSGSDLQVQYQAGSGFVLASAYSFLYAQNLTLSEPLILMPANRGWCSLKYQYPKKGGRLREISAELLFTAVSRQNRFPRGQDYAEPPAAYQLLDLNLGAAVPCGATAIRISFSVRNIFNSSYRDYLSRFRYFTDEPGRNFIIRMNIPFTIYSKKTNHEK